MVREKANPQLGANLNWLERWRWFVDNARTPRLRTMREFAEQEIVIPDGPYAGRRFRCTTQPYTGLFFDAVDSGLWPRIVSTGPTQSGKSLVCYVIPALFHLFEVGETVVLGLPDMDMAADKWREDIRPVIERSRYADLLPSRGGGSRGGTRTAIQFDNGATLKFMTAGGDDKSRASFTTRVVIITETDGMDKGSTLHEADKVTQIIARTKADPERAVAYMECTVSVEEGRTWREIKAGTDSRIVLLCPHCERWVSLERGDLKGWEAAGTKMEAQRLAVFVCNQCGVTWSDDERRDANFGGQLLHRGQEITGSGAAAAIEGAPPDTDTLGFRWSAVNNLFTRAGLIGGDEWAASRAADEDNAAREMLQFVWALPYKPPELDLSGVTTAGLIRRQGELPRGIVPDDCQSLVVHVDVGKRLCHYVVMAWRPGASGHVCDYGRFDVASDELGSQRALLLALRDFREVCLAGWGIAGGGTRVPDQVWIDARWQGEEPGSDVVYQFCRESAGKNVMAARFRPALGCGTGRLERKTYRRPRAVNKSVVFIGEGYHVVWLKPHRLYVVEVNADYWKEWIHRRLTDPVEVDGAVMLFKAPPNEHITFAKHLSAERLIEEFKPGVGVTRRWIADRRANHFFDAIYNCGAAGHLCGVRLTRQKDEGKRTKAEKKGSAPGRFATPDGRAYLVTQR